MQQYINYLLNRFQNENPNAEVTDITDEVFCFIQNNPEYLKEYINLIADKNMQQQMNAQIAREITRRYNVKGYQVDKEPKSVLIKSFKLLN
ncbi:MAG: hypothetical protein J6P44_08155 [Bacteroidales bacterium]|nr:hypothetical protein [Bacteroidales bacterium]